MRDTLSKNGAYIEAIRVERRHETRLSKQQRERKERWAHATFTTRRFEFLFFFCSTSSQAMFRNNVCRRFSSSWLSSLRFYWYRRKPVWWLIGGHRNVNNSSILAILFTRTISFMIINCTQNAYQQLCHVTNKQDRHTKNYVPHDWPALVSTGNGWLALTWKTRGSILASELFIPNHNQSTVRCFKKLVSIVSCLLAESLLRNDPPTVNVIVGPTSWRPKVSRSSSPAHTQREKNSALEEKSIPSNKNYLASDDKSQTGCPLATGELLCCYRALIRRGPFPLASLKILCHFHTLHCSLTSWNSCWSSLFSSRWSQVSRLYTYCILADSSYNPVMATVSSSRPSFDSTVYCQWWFDCMV